MSLAYGDRAGTAPAGMLSRERTIAGPGFNRWLAVPAALAIHLCIGMAYGFSVFWLPMGRLLPGAPACTGAGIGAALISGACNWTVPLVTSIFEVFIVVLGISAAIWGGWLEHAGPRRAGIYAALCWGGGLILAAGAVAVHQLWLVYLVAVLCGVGQGLGYITPVSTLIKWFPDRRGLATGLAIFGYGGGAMVGAPLAVWMIRHFSRGGVPGVVWTLVALGAIYLAVMLIAAFGFRVPPAGWRPAGWTPPASRSDMVTGRHVHLSRAWRTPQFWLIWGVLFLNVTAGIAVISIASPMFQDVFGARLLGHPIGAALTGPERAAIAASAAGLVGLISLFNCLGRLFWASLSDKIGRKATYVAIFVLGIALYCLLPSWGHLGLPALFVISVCIILSMYGGGFSTLPAYLADIFGTQFVGAIHGRLITAWSAAGVVGPSLIATLREVQLHQGVPRALVYDRALYIMAGLLCVGLVCNLLVRPVAEKYWMSDDELARERALQHEGQVAADAQTAARGRLGVGGAIALLAVGVPVAIGLVIALQNAAALL